MQLRTARQQDWAGRVEQWDTLLGIDLKHEDAPDDVLVYFRQLANYYAQLDSGVADSHMDLSALRDASQAVEAWLRREAGRG